MKIGIETHLNMRHRSCLRQSIRLPHRDFQSRINLIDEGSSQGCTTGGSHAQRGQIVVLDSRAFRHMKHYRRRNIGMCDGVVLDRHAELLDTEFLHEDCGVALPGWEVGQAD